MRRRPSLVPTNTMSAEEEFKANVQDIFFDYDTDAISAPMRRPRSRRTPATWSSHPDIKIVIGGYCDERGSDEYNLALGQNRADSAKNALVTAGVAASRIRVISYGKEKPFCTRVERAVLAAEPPRRLHDGPVEQRATSPPVHLMPMHRGGTLQDRSVSRDIE